MVDAKSEILHKAFAIKAGGLDGVYRVVFVQSLLNLIYVHFVGPRPTNKSDSSDSADAACSVGSSQSRCRAPIAMVLSDFQALKPEDRAPVAISIDLRYRQPQSSLTDGQKKRYTCVHKRLAAISEAAVLEEMLVFGRFSSKLEAVAGAHHVHRTTLGRELSRLFDCGSDLHVATMSIVLAGGSRKSTERVVVHKLGRKPKCVVTGHDPDAIGVNTSEEAKKAIGLLLQGTKDRDKLTVAELYRRYKDGYAKRAVGAMADGTVIFEPIPEMKITEGAFRYHVALLETKAAIARAKLGSCKFAKDLRTLLSHSKELINYPGHTYIIDSTVGDVYLVCAVDRRLLIGRPVIYVVMDAFSSLILSVHVSLEGPSLEQAEIALYRAMTPKDKLLDFLGKSSLLDALPQGCRPTFVFSDRGELLSNGARHMAERTGIAQSLAAAYRADWKGMLERYFGIQNELVIHWLPGAVRQRMRERGDRDVRLDAILTVNELLRILLSLAAEWNLTHDMTRHVSGAMLRKGIEATPISFYEYGLEALHGAPKFLERSDAIRQFLTPLDFNATRKGLELGNLRFTSPWMRDDDTFYDMRGSKASVFLNPDQPRSAFVLEPESKELDEVSLVDMRGYAEEDVSIGDIQMVEDYLPLKRGDEKKAQENIEPTLRGQRAAIIAEARAKTAAAKADDTRSKTQQTNGQKQNRAAAIASQVAGSPPVLPAAPKAASPEDDIWLQAMTEKFQTEGAK